MRATLRTWMGSWQVWVSVACLVCIGLIHWQGPHIVAVWPWSLWVIRGFLFLALVGVGLIVSDPLARYVLHPFFMFVMGDKKFPSRTSKAKEKAADSLMSVSNAIHSATWISLLVFPLTAFIQSRASGTDLVSALGLLWQPDRWSWWHTGVFTIVFFLPLSMGRSMQRRALDIYDQIAPPSPPPPAPAMAPTTQGITESPTAPAEAKTTPASANGGRRQRRHRAK